MRILLAQHAPYVPSYGGANRSNRILLEQLAERGHACRAVTLAAAQAGPGAIARLRGELASRQVTPRPRGDEAAHFDLRGVEVEAYADTLPLKRAIAGAVAAHRPDWVIVSSEDPGQVLLEAAFDAAPARVIYLARTTLALPCGPDAALPSEAKTRLLARAAAVVCNSPFMRDYVGQWSGVTGVVLPISPCAPPREDSLDARERHARGFVALINPCAVKGIDILLALARRMPDVAFAAVPTWGTTAADRARLSATPNVTIVDAREDVDEIYRDVRVLLVPSLWAEGRGRVVLEAHLRGIPVLAADVGGLREEMSGLDYVLPVDPIRAYRMQLDDRSIPEAIVPPQEPGPWERALRELLDDPARYAALSAASARAAAARSPHETVDAFESFLIGRPARSAEAVSSASSGPLPAPAGAAPGPRRLTAEQRAYVAQRLRAGASRPSS